MLRAISLFSASPTLLTVVVACFAWTCESSAAGEETFDSMTTARIERILNSAKDVTALKEIGNGKYAFVVGDSRIVLTNIESFVVLSAQFKGRVSLTRINDWNRTKPLGRAFLDGDDDPVLSCDVCLLGGVTENHIHAQIAIFSQNVKKFKAHLEE